MAWVMRVTVLVLGADGFIGRHIAFALRDAGHEAIASARRVERLQAMGFRTLQADLSDPASHAPGFWAEAQDCALVNAAGLLTGTETAFAAVHEHALRAVLATVAGPARPAPVWHWGWPFCATGGRGWWRGHRSRWSWPIRLACPCWPQPCGSTRSAQF